MTGLGMGRMRVRVGLRTLLSVLALPPASCTPSLEQVSDLPLRERYRLVLSVEAVAGEGDIANNSRERTRGAP